MAHVTEREAKAVFKSVTGGSAWANPSEWRDLDGGAHLAAAERRHGGERPARRARPPRGSGAAADLPGAGADQGAVDPEGAVAEHGRAPRRRRRGVSVWSHPTRSVSG